jgi:hypothetical protein
LQLLYEKNSKYIENLEGYADVRTYVCTDVHMMDGQTDGRTDRHVDRWTDRWTNRLIDR